MFHHFQGVDKAEKKDCIFIGKGKIWAANIHRKYTRLNSNEKLLGSSKPVAKAGL